jgi:endonuclease-3
MSNSNPKKHKASDRLAVAHKVLGVLRKKYGQALPRQALPVLETVLFAACLENVSQGQAEAVYARLLASFHDLNEIRVSSISEIEQVLCDLPQPEWRALRIREALQFTFENYYSFDLDQLKRKTLDVAEKQLGQIRYLSPFIRAYTLQHCLGAHVVPVDELSCTVLAWLGLVPGDASSEAAGEEMKGALRKNESAQFCHLIRAVASDRKYAGTFAFSGRAAEGGAGDLPTAAKRLLEHLARPPKKPVTKAHRKPARNARKAASSPRGHSARGSVRKRVSKPKAGAARKKRPTAR